MSGVQYWMCGGRRRAEFLEVERCGYDLEPQEVNALNLPLLSLAAGCREGWERCCCCLAGWWPERRIELKSVSRGWPEGVCKESAKKFW